MRQAPELWIKAVERYRCSKCCKHHYSDTELEVYINHLYWCPKDGVDLVVESIAARGCRYGLPQYSHHSVRE